MLIELIKIIRENFTDILVAACTGGIVCYVLDKLWKVIQERFKQ